MSYSFCQPNSQLRQIPIYHLENVIARSVPSLGARGKIVPEMDPDEVADRLVADPELDEFCWSLYFDPVFLVRLFYSGFLPICSNIGAPGDPIYVLLPKLHFFRSTVCLQTDASGLPCLTRKLAKRLDQFTLRVNTDFDAVVAGCFEQHKDRCWLFPPLLAALKNLNEKKFSPFVKVHSVEVYQRGGRLVAGEIGYAVGSVYTSMTGFHRESGTGTVQLVLLHRRLREKKFTLWDLGMEMEYKTRALGASLKSRSEFVQELRRLRNDIHVQLV